MFFRSRNPEGQKPSTSSGGNQDDDEEEEDEMMIIEHDNHVGDTDAVAVDRMQTPDDNGSESTNLILRDRKVNVNQQRPKSIGGGMFQFTYWHFG